MSRVSACINALLLITDTSASTTVEQAGSETNDIQPVMEPLEPFCYIPNSSTALRALCVRGLAIREFLLFLADLDAEELLNQKFPKYLTPLYKVTRMWKTTETAQWTHLAGVSPTASNPLPSDKEMWADVLYDGSPINFAVLAYAILSRAHDDDIRLDMAWKMFEILLKMFSLCQVRASALARAGSGEVLFKTRAEVSKYQRAPITPLLEMLNIVISGPRLAEVFIYLPQPRLLSRRIEAIFRREQLRDSELLKAFAAHLPGLVTENTPEVSKGYMERLILED